MSTTLPLGWIPRLLEWAAQHHPTAAAQTRAVAGRPEVYARYVARLDDLWFTWAYREMTPTKGWTQEQVNAVLRQADQLEATGQSPQTAARNAFLGAQDARGRAVA